MANSYIKPLSASEISDVVRKSLSDTSVSLRTRKNNTASGYEVKSSNGIARGRSIFAKAFNSARKG
ncbi:hypothetical protein HGT70_14425 [Rosenbergiella collisarenosi]|uniref:hypothetical protein n=1 Tax=Rosenbergiella collisarenosi TaxID=1544695 RepID=UPI001BDB69B3|nr:hypothetical protein [Rosenbergiella collisarenosi]MBT0722470.1 hypothetical protein [Rosenbergiella collisarenosi]